MRVPNVFLAIVLMPWLASAQTGTINGTVRDQFGAFIREASIDAWNASTESVSAPEHIGSTDALGRYSVQRPVGTWGVCIEAIGFHTQCKLPQVQASRAVDFSPNLHVKDTGNPQLLNTTPDVPLSLYAGQWTSSSKMFDTAMSRAQEISAKLNCNWTPDEKFLICNQVIKDARGTHSQLTVYSHDEKQNAYVYSTFNMPGAQPNFSKLEVGDHRFIYNGSFEQNGKKTLFRTTNTFSNAGDRYDFVAEFSTDDGAHWTKTLEGTATRVSP